MLIDSIPHDSSYLVVWLITGSIALIMLIRAIRTIGAVMQDGVIEYVKDDWLDRLPHRLDTMKFKGLNRPAYTLICLMYYSLKSVFVFVIYALVRVYKFILWDIWIWIFKVDKRAWFRSLFSEDDEDIEDEEIADEDIEDGEHSAYDDDEDDLHFCQLFTIGEEMCLLVDHIEMCPDETAFIRVADDEGYTPLYKRKVRRDKLGNRFIIFNSTNHYLDDSKTQPVSIKK